MGKKSKRDKKLKKSKCGSSKTRKRHPSSSSSASSSDASPSLKSAGYQWEDKTAPAPAPAPRKDWFASISEQAMEANMFLGSVTSSKIRAAEKERLAQDAVKLGAGLVINRLEAPSEQSGSQAQQQAPPPHNPDWYRRAHRRCQEQAREEGRPIEEVAAERWGSLDRLRRLMRDDHPPGRSGEGSGGVHQPRWKRRSPEGEDKPSGREADADWRKWQSVDRRSDSDGRRPDAESRGSDANWRRLEAERRESGANWRRSEAESCASDGNRQRSEPESRLRPGMGEQSQDGNKQKSEPESRASNGSSQRSEPESRASDGCRQRSEPESRASDGSRQRSEPESRAPNGCRQRSEPESRASDANWRKPRTGEPRSEAESRKSDFSLEKPETEERRFEAKEKQRGEADIARSDAEMQSLQGSASTSAAAMARPEMVTVEEERHVRMDDINQLSAQILRSQMDGDLVKAGKLEKRLSVLREAQRRKLKVRIKQRVSKPVAAAAAPSAVSAAQPTRRPGLHDLGAAASVEELRAHERLIDSRAMQLDFAGAWRPKAAATAGDDDDEYSSLGPESKAKRPRQHNLMDSAADRERALAGQKLRAAGRRCVQCLAEGDAGGDAESAKLTRGLMIECGARVYLRLPEVRSLVDKHCLLSTVSHVTCCALLDDDAFADLERLKRHLVDRLGRQGLDCVFVETAKGLGRHPHLQVEAFPLPKEVGESASIYFRKALMDAGPEWATNRKAVPLRDMDIRRTVPPGFPYLAVEFGRDSGLVHVIEDESAFPGHFGREVVAGMLDLPHELWRKPKRDSWEALLAKASEFRFFWSDSGEVVIGQGD